METDSFSVPNAIIDDINMLELLAPPVESPNLITFNNSALPEPGKLQKAVRLKGSPLTTKKAVELLLNGTLKSKVCRYCLKVALPLSELDQVLQVTSGDVLFKVTIREMIASFHPIKVADDANFPNKICEKCLDHTISSYLFKQQCEKSERALRNCFEDIFDKLEKLDPLEKQKKRGRQKFNPNPNILYVEHVEVIDYAEPLITLVNISSELLSEAPNLTPYTCPKCLQILPNIESLISHEKSHPKSMWFHCQQCGKSFVKRNHLRRHLQTDHISEEQRKLEEPNFKCRNCGTVSADYSTHLQHIEKHKFKTVMEHVITRKMDELCALCLNKGSKLCEMEKNICLHGGYPELMGNMTLYSMLGSTIPEMNILHNYTGSKICEKCLNHAITSYVFVHKTLYIRNRLATCINALIDNLNKIIKPQDNIFIEISQDLIMPPNNDEFDENFILENLDDIDESKLKIEVLEDEFRTKSESEESDNETQVNEMQDKVNDAVQKVEDGVQDKIDESEKTLDSDDYILKVNPLKQPLRTYSKSNILNGINSVSTKRLISDVCSEFLTFKKKRKPTRSVHTIKFACPLCDKKFISEYFLKRHVLKHVFRKNDCLICGNSFKSKFCLYEHTKFKHILKQMNYTSCKICGRSFSNDMKLYAHKKCHTTKECDLCDKSFVSQMYYNNHLQRHIAKLRIIKQKSVQTCSFCEKECANDNNLSVHVNKVHLQIKPYGCDMCERQFYTEYNLSNHKRVHSFRTKETCLFCNKTFKCRKHLVVHVRKHIDSRPHLCQICEQAFHSQTKLKKHLKMCHGGSFCCKLCKIAFDTKSELKAHVNRVHSMF